MWQGLSVEKKSLQEESIFSSCRWCWWEVGAAGPRRTIAVVGVRTLGLGFKRCEQSCRDRGQSTPLITPKCPFRSILDLDHELRPQLGT